MTNIFLGAVMLLVSVLLLPASALTATGRYEVYCDGVGIFLAKIDDVPAPGKLVLFSHLSLPLGTAAGRYLGQGKWSDVFVYRGGCVPDGKCDTIAHGKVWIDVWDTSDQVHMPPKRISGQYEVDLNGKHLQGTFVVKRRFGKDFRTCM